MAFDEDQELTLIGSASPDECFIAIGDSAPISDDGTCEPGTPKTNQAYVWSLARSGSKLWFGTGANVNCLVGSTFLGASNPSGLPGSYVCEYGQSEFLSNSGITLSPPFDAWQLPEQFGDWRPPKIYVLDTNSESPLIEVTAGFSGRSKDLINTTVGLRAAGAVGSVVYLAGPALIGGINVFAFNASTNALVGAANLSDFSNIRNFRVYDGDIYAGVADSTLGGGSLLKFSGGVSNPLEVTTVLNGNWGEIAEFDFLNDTLYFGTWPNLSARVEAAVYRIELSDLDLSGPEPIQFDIAAEIPDPAIGRIWTASDYEPDSVIAMTYGVGALAAFDGQIYWGTMHVPYTSLLAKFAAYGPPISEQALAQDFLGTLRASTLYRYSLPAEGELDRPELLYGNLFLPVCNPDPVPDPPADPPAPLTCTWTTQPNDFGLPRFGLAGLGNPFNNYIWSMAEFDQELYVGTMDWSYLIIPTLPGSPDIRIFQASSLVDSFLGQIDSAIEALRLELASQSLVLPDLVSALTALRDLLTNVGNLLTPCVDGENCLDARVEAAAENLSSIITEINELGDTPVPEQVAALVSDINAVLDSIELLLPDLETFLDSTASQFPDLRFGADLFRFTSNRELAAEDLSVDGLGNQMNYGIRTMVTDSDSLYLGTANPMNLSSNGGWELYQLTVPEVVALAPVLPIRTPRFITPPLQVTPTILSGYPGDLINVPGENFQGIDASLAGSPLQPISNQSNLFDFLVPDMKPGMHKLRFYQSSTGSAFEFDFEIKQRPVVSTSKLNVGSFNGYVAIYAKGHKGSTLSWKIAGKWFKTTVTKDFQVFQRRTASAGKQVQVELFVNGVKPASLSMRLTTK